MLLFNKILAVLNLLGAIVLMTFMSLDVLQRHTWNKAVEAQRIAVEGPALTEKDEDVSTPPGFTGMFKGNKLDSLSSRMDKDLQEATKLSNVRLGTIQLGDVSAQRQAAEKLKQAIDRQLDTVKDDPGKSIAETARFLMPLVDTYAARQRLIALRTFQAPDGVNKRLVDQLDTALTATFQKWKAPNAPDETAAAFAAQFHQAMQLAGPGESRRQLADAFLKALTVKAGGAAKLAEAVTKGAAGGDEGPTLFLRAARNEEGKARPALMEDTFFEATNYLLEAQLAAAIRPALDSLRNHSTDMGQKPFFNYVKITREVHELVPANEDPAEKTAREQREALVKMAKAAVDKQENLLDADKQRVLAFRVAYLMAIAAQPGEEKDPYSLAMIDLLTADPARVKPAFDAAEAAWDKTTDSASEETAVAFVKTLLGSQDAALKTVEAVLAPREKEVLQQLNDELRADLDYQFDLALKTDAIPRRTPRGVEEDPSTRQPVSQSAQQKPALAQVLFCLSEVPLEAPSAWLPPPAAETPPGELSEKMKTVIRIVGLKQAALELNREAAALEPMPEELRRRTDDDRNTFILAHLLLEAQVRDAAVAAREQVEEEKKYDDLIKAREAIVGKPGGMTGRYSDVESFEKRVADEQKITKERLTQLESMSKALFDIRIKVRDAITLTQQYEDGIRYLELRRP